MASAVTVDEQVASLYSKVLGVKFTGTYIDRKSMPLSGVNTVIERDIVEVDPNDPLSELMEEIFTDIKKLNLGTIWKGFVAASESYMDYNTRIYTKSKVGGDGIGTYKIEGIEASQLLLYASGVEISLNRVG